MSFKKTSMPSITESDNEEDELDKVSGNEEDISTSDYSSLKREKKDATLTKMIDEEITNNILEDDELRDKVSTLRISNNNDDDSVNSNSNIKTIPSDEINEELQPDRFGFYQGSHYTDPNSDLNVPISVQRSRERKWQHMVCHWSDYCINGRRHRKLISRCRKGVPQALRCRVWQLLAGSRSLEGSVRERELYIKQQKSVAAINQNVFKSRLSRMSLRAHHQNNNDTSNNSINGVFGSTNASGVGSGMRGGGFDSENVSISSYYSAFASPTSLPLAQSQQLQQSSTTHYHELYMNYQKITPPPEVTEQILKDIHRQFPDHETFTSRGGMGQESLANLLTVYSIRHPETGYCQGMAPVASALLMVMPEEDAFWTFDRVCDAYIPGYYDEGLKQIQVDAKALEMLVKNESNSCHQMFKRVQLDPICFMVDWFMCIYIRTLPWPSVLLVLDMFLCEGKAVLFKVALVLIQGVVNFINNKANGVSEEELLHTLRRLPPGITTPQYLMNHLPKLSISKYDIRRECESQSKSMEKTKKQQQLQLRQSKHLQQNR